MNNRTLLQYFHWYYPNDGSLWKKITEEAEHLSKTGFTSLWLPPPTKGNSGGYSVGYDAYDLYDLGEFDQKSSIRTKYGTREEFIAAVGKAHEHQLKIVADVVLNHKAGGDELERFYAQKVNPDNRDEVISGRFEIEAWTKFTFPGRQGRYSSFIWDFMCFTGTDWAHDISEEGIYSIITEYGDKWQEGVDCEKGCYDYLMYCDIEYRNPSVREEIKRWVDWFINEHGIDGFRLDAIKHMPVFFINELLDHLEQHHDPGFFVVGEYWDKTGSGILTEYVDNTRGRIQLFDAPLQQNLHIASRQAYNYDLRMILDNSSVQRYPTRTVTLVDNHDTQPLQKLEAVVEPWFKPIAYALILLQEHGIPCVFFADLYGARYTDKGKDGNEYEITLLPVNELPKLVGARRHLAYGQQHYYFDHPNCIGFTREGHADFPHSGIAVLISNGSEGFKRMYMGAAFAGKELTDITGNRSERIKVNNEGEAEFRCNAGSVSVWATEDANRLLGEAGTTS